MKSFSIRAFLAALVLILLMTGCAQTTTDVVPTNFRWATVQGGQIDFSAAGEQFYFTVPVDSWLIDSGLPIHVEVKGRVEQGGLTFELRQPDGTVAWTSSRLGGEYEIKQDIVPNAGILGDYQLGMVYEAGTRASYDIGWHSLVLTPTILVPGIGMTLVALLAAAWVLRKGGTWRMIGWGALFWAFTVALKFAFAIPVNTPLSQALGVSYQNPWTAGNIIFYVYVGLLTGIFEVLVAWLVLRKRALGHASWTQALAFGVGFGAVEALLLGLMSFGQSLGSLVAADVLPIHTLVSMANNNEFLFAIAPVLERVSVIMAHVFTCVAIFFAIATRQSKWMWMAVLYKSILDIPAGMAAFIGVNNSLPKLWAVEGLILFFGLIGLWATWRISLRYPAPGDTPTVPPAGIEQVTAGASF